MNETTKNFWQAWQAWDRSPPPAPSFRLYYDENGDPIVYSMESLAGNYIEVDALTYATADYRVRVVDNKIVPLTVNRVKKLKPHSQGTPCHPKNVAVVVESSNVFWKKI